MNENGRPRVPRQATLTELLAQAENGLRDFNTRTQRPARVLPGPADAYRCLSGLDHLVQQLPQALTQLCQALEHHRTTLDLRTDPDTGHSDEDGRPVVRQAQDNLAQAALITEKAALLLMSALSELRSAHALTGVLGIEPGDDDGYNTADDTDHTTPAEPAEQARRA